MNNKKRVQVILRMTEEEKKQALENAKYIGFNSFNSFAIERLTTPHNLVKLEIDDEVFRKSLTELNMIGNNLNQIARNINFLMKEKYFNNTDLYANIEQAEKYVKEMYNYYMQIRKYFFLTSKLMKHVDIVEYLQKEK